MKYVFGIASNLVFYEANKLIELDGLNPNDCIFFLLRNYSIPQRFFERYPNQIQTSYNTTSGEGRVFAGWNIFQTRRNVRQFDQLVDSYINNDSFIWYTQVCSNDFCSLMVSKKNCVGYYILEDGTGSYSVENPTPFIGLKYFLFRFVLKPLWPRIYCVKEHFIETNHTKFLGCIGTSQQSFPLHQSSLRVIGDPFVPEYLPTPPDAILSVDALFLYFNIQETEEIFGMIAEALNAKKYSHVYYKHHPYILAPANHMLYEQYEQIIHKYIKGDLIQLPASACLENILTAYRSDFYTVYSSVAIYANNAGCICYSPLHRVKDKIPTKIALVEEISQPI